LEFLVVAKELAPKSKNERERERERERGRERERHTHTHTHTHRGSPLSLRLCLATMGRAPCCDKIGLKKGPWTPDEDQKLVDYIASYGHGSWRALPKEAGT